MKRVALLILVPLLSACGSSPTAPTPHAPVAAPRPARSVLTLGVQNATYTPDVKTSTLECGAYRAEWVITESAGLPARITRSDAYLRQADGDITARDVMDRSTPVQASGQTLLLTLRDSCGLTRSDLPMVMVVRLDLTDDQGNAHTLTGETGFVER